ncbi:EamA family transporter RarD [Planosporangium sp. 12N6]|uniref:EamA family transporter RarD n=1 Tax=Planosporangium spinosum TaxID=3402278 RepID=UPI003CF8703D
MSQLRRGYVFGFAAYMIWGFFPLYWKQLADAGPIEILAHRIVWSAVFVTVLLLAMRNWRFLRPLVRRPRMLAGITLAAVMIAINWGMYIYGVNSGHVVETSLGYYINPLVTVLLGVVVLRERLRTAQWLALAVGAAAVAVLAVDYGRLPWIALSLAVSFALYGLIKKSLALPAAEGLFVESLALTAPALGYLGWLAAQHRSTFGHGSALQTALLVLAGAVTAIPLLMFAGAANRIPLSSLGLLQYLTPTLQLGCGVLIYHEPMPATQLAGFALVWVALAVFAWDGIRHSRGLARQRAGAQAEEVAATASAT